LQGWHSSFPESAIEADLVVLGVSSPEVSNEAGLLDGMSMLSTGS